MAADSPSTYATVKSKVTEVSEKTRTSISDLTDAGKTKAKQVAEVAKDPHVQVTAVSAVGGGAVDGTAGGTTGAITGGVVGGIVGVPAAIFTFGLSIPFCAVVGASVGGGIGATTGATTGAATGGAAGYYGYKHKDEIKATADSFKTKAMKAIGFVTQKVKDTTQSIGDGYASLSGKVSSAIGRDGSTGGSKPLTN